MTTISLRQVILALNALEFARFLCEETHVEVSGYSPYRSVRKLDEEDARKVQGSSRNWGRLSAQKVFELIVLPGYGLEPGWTRPSDAMVHGIRALRSLAESLIQQGTQLQLGVPVLCHAIFSSHGRDRQEQSLSQLTALEWNRVEQWITGFLNQIASGEITEEMLKDPVEAPAAPTGQGH